jgi:formylglycine-generating enzyme required for sulfatase activity
MESRILLGRKPPAFGLYDMHGNLWEWVEDAWHDSYEDAPTDGAPQDGNTSQRVMRGGSWYDIPQFLRAAGRNRSITDNRDVNIGFRLARMLSP